MDVIGGDLVQTEIRPELFREYVEWIDRSENTTKSYLMDLRQFHKWLTDRQITTPTRQTIIDYRTYLVDSGYQPTTINAYLRSTKKFFQWLEESGRYPDISKGVRCLKINNDVHKRDALLPEDVTKLEACITDSLQANGGNARKQEQGLRLLALTQLATNCGLRDCELARMNVQDLEAKNGEPVLWIYGKGRDAADQKMPIAPEVAQTVYRYLQARSDEITPESPMFTATGNRSGGQRLSTTSISKLLKKALQTAGFDSPRLTAHSLRHTAGTCTMMITGDLYKTQKFMRHANPQTTEVYLHDIDDGRAREAAESLYTLYHPDPDADRRRQPPPGMTANELKEYCVQEVLRRLQDQ